MAKTLASLAGRGTRTGGGEAALRQVSEAVQCALAESPDERLQALAVVAVDPAPDTSRLLVTFTPMNPGVIDPPSVLACLEAASARLRWAVANAVTRRRAPSLAFRLLYA